MHAGEQAETETDRQTDTTCEQAPGAFLQGRASVNKPERTRHGTRLEWPHSQNAGCRCGYGCTYICTRIYTRTRTCTCRRRS